MVNTMADKLLLLLSTDWFQDFWPAVGVRVRANKTISLKQDLRREVASLLTGVSDYWSITFDSERVDRTRSALYEATQKYQADDGVLKRIQEVVLGNEVSPAERDESWLLSSLTEMLMSGQVDGSSATLSSNVVDRLKARWASLEQVSPALRRRCLDSTSEWDIYVRSLTPGLPTFLADFAQEIVGTDRFRTFWAIAKADLMPAEREQLIAWYRATGSELTGQAVEFAVSLAEP